MVLISNPDDVDEASIALPAISVEIGDLKVCAVIRTTESSVMHQKVFKKIYHQSYKNKDENFVVDVKHIELDFTIDGHSVTMAFTVLKDLYMDMVLGHDFLENFNVGLHLGLGLMKWKYENQVIITEFVKTQESLRAISGGSIDCEQKEKVSNNRRVDMQSSEEINQPLSAASTSHETNVATPPVFGKDNYSKSEKSQGIKANKTKGKREQETSSSVRNSKSSSDKSVKPASSIKGILKKDSKKWVKVFVIDSHLISKYTARHYGYYGILWGDKHKNNLVHYEPLDGQDLTGDGIHLIALKHIFQQAVNGKIDYLHILSENELVMDAMLAYQNNDQEKLANLKPGSCDEFYFENEFKIFTETCKAAGKIKAIKYEFVPYEKSMKEMLQLREDVWKDFTFQALQDFHYGLESSSSSDSSFSEPHFCF